MPQTGCTGEAGTNPADGAILMDQIDRMLTEEAVAGHFETASEVLAMVEQARATAAQLKLKDVGEELQPGDAAAQATSCQTGSEPLESDQIDGRFESPDRILKDDRSSVATAGFAM